MSKCEIFSSQRFGLLKWTILISSLLCNSVALSQWTDEDDGFSTLILHPDNDDVVVIDEGPDFIRYGVWYPSDHGDADEYIEFDVEKATWNRFDINTTGATVSDEEAWGWPDGRVDVADVRLFMCLYQDASAYADISSTGAVRGDAEYGVMDGVVDAADLQFFTDWLEDFASINVALQLINDAIQNGHPCTTRASGEPQMAPRQPVKLTAGIPSTVAGGFPEKVDEWLYVLVYDVLKPQSTLDLRVVHYADTDEICAGEPGALHFPDAWTEIGFLVNLSAVVTGLTEVLNDQNYVIADDCLDDGSGMRVGDSTLRSKYRVSYKLGVFVPINAWWAGLGVQRTLLTRQMSGTGCGCP